MIFQDSLIFLDHRGKNIFGVFLVARKTRVPGNHTSNSHYEIYTMNSVMRHCFVFYKGIMVTISLILSKAASQFSSAQLCNFPDQGRNFHFVLTTRLASTSGAFPLHWRFLELLTPSMSNLPVKKMISLRYRFDICRRFFIKIKGLIYGWRKVIKKHLQMI